MKIQSSYKLKNFFKRSLLNLNNLGNDELDDFLEASNNDNRKIYYRESPRYAVSNKTSIGGIEEKGNYTIDFTKLHDAIFDHTEISTHPTVTSIFTNNKNSTFKPNSNDVKIPSNAHELKQNKGRDFYAKENDSTHQQFNFDEKPNLSLNITNNYMHQIEIMMGNANNNKMNTKEEVQAVKQNGNPMFVQNALSKDKVKNETASQNSISKNAKNNHILTHPLILENKPKNDTLIKLPVSPKNPEPESKHEFENEEAKNSKWDVLNKHHIKEYEEKISLVITNKNTVEKSNNNQTQKATVLEATKSKKNVLEVKETKHNQQENHNMLWKHNKTQAEVSSNSTVSHQNKNIIFNSTVLLSSKPNNEMHKPPKNNETKPTLVDKKEQNCDKLEQTIKNESESLNHLFEDKLNNLKKSIKHSFNQLLLQNHENFEENKKQNFDMLNNLDTLIKSLVKNVTHSHHQQMSNLHSETMNQLKQLKEAVKVNNIQEEKLLRNILNNTVNIQKENQNANKSKLKQAKITIKNATLNGNQSSLNASIKGSQEVIKEGKHFIIVKNHGQEGSNLRNKNKSVVWLKPEIQKEKEKELNADEKFTNKFLANVISKLISHPLHIDSDEIETEKHSTKTNSPNNKPGVVIISNSSGTKIENKNINNYNSHNSRVYS